MLCNLRILFEMNKNVVAFLGSSSTAGKGQAYDWIGELRRRTQNGGFHFYNFGVGADLAQSGHELRDDVGIEPVFLPNSLRILGLKRARFCHLSLGRYQPRRVSGRPLRPSSGLRSNA
jgi:hypothetical protein